jgi:hypothetical protein
VPHQIYFDVVDLDNSKYSHAQHQNKFVWINLSQSKYSYVPHQPIVAVSDEYIPSYVLYRQTSIWAGLGSYKHSYAKRRERWSFADE